MVKWITALSKHIVVVLSSLIFLQFPQFILNYQQQLSGHVAEIQQYVDKMRNLAAQSGKSLDHYIQKFISYPDVDFSKQGTLMQFTYIRANKLFLHLERLKQASPLMRPFVWITGMQGDIFHSTLSSFKPGLTFSLESLMYGLLGIGLGSILNWIGEQIGRKLFFFNRKRQRRFNKST